MSVSTPSTRIDTGRVQPSGSTGPIMIAIGIAVAKIRTESPKPRVTMKVTDANRRVFSPNRRSSSVYAVTSSPW